MTLSASHDPEGSRRAVMFGSSLLATIWSRVDAATVIGWTITLVVGAPAIYAMLKSIKADVDRRREGAMQSARELAQMSLERDLANACAADLQKQLDAARAHPPK